MILRNIYDADPFNWFYRDNIEEEFTAKRIPSASTPAGKIGRRYTFQFLQREHFYEREH